MAILGLTAPDHPVTRQLLEGLLVVVACHTALMTIGLHWITIAGAILHATAKRHQCGHHITFHLHQMACGMPCHLVQMACRRGLMQHVHHATAEIAKVPHDLANRNPM